MTQTTLIKVKILYKNLRGWTEEREIIPIRIWYGSTNEHPEQQYFVEAVDCEDGKTKDFALLGLRGETNGNSGKTSA